MRAKAVAAVMMVVLACALVGAVLVSRPSDWEPLWLVFALLAVVVASDTLSVEIGGIRVSTSLSVLVLAMVLLGPAPAVAISLAAMSVDAVRDRLPPLKLLDNFGTFAFFSLVGGLVARQFASAEESVALAGAVMAVFAISVLLNFTGIWLAHCLRDRLSFRAGLTEVFAPTLPAQIAMAILTSFFAVVALQIGLWTLPLLILMLLVFQYLLRYARRTRQRMEELAERNQELAALRVGLVTTMLQTLALRDHVTARHSAAVARYSRAIAEAHGLDEHECDLIHTAALFHDVGKFIFPDRVLFAHGELSETDHALIRHHPEVGADLVSEIEGYEPVADIVRHHHERIDGQGYPRALAGDAIPLGARIIAVADVYDVITARDTYRAPRSAAEACEELRRVAGAQLDTEFVEIFIDLVERRGVRFRHSDDIDFEAELRQDWRLGRIVPPVKVG